MIILKKKKNTDYDAKISDIKSKYVATADYHKFTKDIVPNRIKSEELINTSGIAGFITNADLDKKKKSSSTSNKNRIKNRIR